MTEARPTATPAGELKKNRITGGPPMPKAPLKRPDAAPVATVATGPGMVLSAKPRHSRATTAITKTEIAIRIGAAGTCASSCTPIGVATAAAEQQQADRAPMDVAPDARQHMQAGRDLQHEDRRHDLRRRQRQRQRGDGQQREAEAAVAAHDGGAEDAGDAVGGDPGIHDPGIDIASRWREAPDRSMGLCQRATLGG